MSKVIIWNADERILPGFGVVKKGDRKSVPEHVAKSYVYQGLANYPSSKKEKSK